MANAVSGDGESAEQKLFLSLAEQLHVSFLQLTRLQESDSVAANRTSMSHTIAEAAMQLTESYMLSLRLRSSTTSLALEPVSVLSVLREAADELGPFAKLLGVQLSFDCYRGLQPVMTDRSVLKAAFISLGQVLLMAESQSDAPEPVVLAAKRSRYGVTAGLYGLHNALNVSAFRRARQLQGVAAQPIQSLLGGPAAGVFIAESLLEAITCKLFISQNHNLKGLAVTLVPCQQLRLV